MFRGQVIMMQSRQQQEEAVQIRPPIPIQATQAQAEQEMARTLGWVCALEVKERLSEPGALQSADPTVRGEALRALSAMRRTLHMVVERKRKVDVLMAELLRETRRMRRARQTRMVSGVLISLALLALVIWSRGEILGNYWFVFTAFASGGGAAASDVAKRRHEMAQALALADEPRVVGVLAMALWEGDGDVKRLASQSLMRLLPRVKASDAPYIDAEQMSALLNLAAQDSPAMQIPLLKALEQIGDKRAQPLVERLAQSAREPVRRQAEECLHYLQERLRRAQEQATLLRGSSTPAIAAEPRQLLRPAAGVPTETPAEELLRVTPSDLAG